MNRKGFLTSLLALPLLAFIKPEAKRVTLNLNGLRAKEVIMDGKFVIKGEDLRAICIKQHSIPSRIKVSDKLQKSGL